MKKILLLSTIVLIATAFQTDIDRKRHRIKSATYYPDGRTIEYFYNPDGQIARVHDSKGNNTSYEYLKGKILRKYYDVVKGLSFVDILSLNENRLVISITSNNPASITEKRDFNQGHYLVQTTLYDKMDRISGVLTYEYQNGNLISSIATDTSGSKIATNTYQYYTDQTNTIGDDNIGEGFVGSSSKNPLKSEMSQLVNLPPVYYYYSYYYDEKGRIKIKVGYKDSGEMTDSISYTYY
jgi:YD repeat-containing protein